MGYIIGLFLILVLIFYSFNSSGFNINGFSADIFDSVKSKIYDTVFPKSEKEISINKLGSNYNNLSRFFNEKAPALLKSASLTNEDKKVLSAAISVFNDSRAPLENIKNAISSNKGVVRSIVEKVFNINDRQSSEQSTEPTYIPPQCKMVCGE